MALKDELQRLGHGPTRNSLPIKPMPKVSEITPHLHPKEQKRREELDEANDLWRKSLAFPPSSVTTIIQQVAAPGTGGDDDVDVPGDGEVPEVDLSQVLRNQRLIFIGGF